MKSKTAYLLATSLMLAMIFTFALYERDSAEAVIGKIGSELISAADAGNETGNGAIASVSVWRPEKLFTGRFLQKPTVQKLLDRKKDSIYSLYENRGQNREELLADAQKILGVLLGCVKSDRCQKGQSETLAHEVARIARFIDAAVRVDHKLTANIERDIFLRLLQVQKSSVQQVALQTLLQPGITDEEFAEILEQDHHFNGDAKAVFYSSLSSRSVASNECRREALLKNILRSFRIESPHTILHLAENFDSFQLSRPDAEQVLASVCYIKRQHRKQVIWPQLQQLLRGALEASQSSLNFTKLCRS